MFSDNRFPIAILISGNGSNLQAIIEASKNLNLQICVVISNNANAYGLKRAELAGIPTLVLPHTEFPDRQSFEIKLCEALQAYQPQLVVLAGFMRILGPHVIQQFPSRIINIHPSLLPKFPGLNTHERAILSGEKEHGCSIHFVTEDLDSGPIIAQASIAISADETSHSLLNKVQKIEHLLYPEVISWIAKGRIKKQNNQVLLDNMILPITGLKYLVTENQFLLKDSHQQIPVME